MRYFKITSGAYIYAVGKGCSGEEITEEDYLSLQALIRQKPAATQATDFRLRTDLTWEEYEAAPPEADPEVGDAEAFEIIFGGAG